MAFLSGLIIGGAMLGLIYGLILAVGMFKGIKNPHE